MRASFTVVALSCTMAMACAQPAPPEEAPAASEPTGNLGQVMQGILFPNSNLIFDAQSADPGAPPEEQSGSGASSSYGGMYSGWIGVENAGIALAEAADLIMKPGRVCSNGTPVPVESEDWIMFSEGLRAAGRATLAAAQAKDQDQVIEITGNVAEACALCHEVYRDAGPAGSPERCVPAPPL
jgi:hypothetical protein